MISHDGLASVVCETTPARVLAGIAVLMNALALYFFFTEVQRSAKNNLCFSSTINRVRAERFSLVC